MPTNLYRSDVLSALESIKGACAEKPLVPILTHVLFRDDSVMAYDSEIGIRAKLKSPVASPFNVRLTPFLMLMKALEDEDLSIDVDKAAVKVQCGTHKSTFQQISEEFPRPAVKVKPEDWREVPAGFKEAVERALASASESESNIQLSSVCVAGDFVYGCDGKRAIRCKVKGLKSGTMLLSKKACRELIKLGNPKRLAVKDSVAMFDYHNIMLLTRLREEKGFPVDNVNKMLSTRKVKFPIPDGFAAAMVRLKLFADAREAPCVELRPEPLGLTLKADGHTGSGSEVLSIWEEAFQPKGVNPGMILAFLPFAESIHFGDKLTDPIYLTGEVASFEAIVAGMDLNPS